MTKKNCNCKNIETPEELGKVMENIGKRKMPFFVKMRLIVEFYVFYFIFVHTSVLNLIFNDKLEPSFPRNLMDKYKIGNG